MSYEVENYVYLNPKAPYMGTKVPVDRTLSEIKGMLQKSGCNAVAWKEEQVNITLGGRNRVVSLVTLAWQHDGSNYMLYLPVILQRIKGKDDLLRTDVAARILRDYVKAQLIMVDLGLLNMAQAMMQHLAIPGPTGPMPMTEFILPHLNELKIGKLDLQMLPAAGGIR